MIGDYESYKDLVQRLNDIQDQNEEILASQRRVEAIVARIADEVKPTLDMLLSNPAIKMFLGIKKKAN